jgi:hypothetical protein
LIALTLLVAIALFLLSFLLSLVTAIANRVLN